MNELNLKPPTRQGHRLCPGLSLWICLRQFPMTISSRWTRHSPNLPSPEFGVTNGHSTQEGPPAYRASGKDGRPIRRCGNLRLYSAVASSTNLPTTAQLGPTKTPQTSHAPKRRRKPAGASRRALFFPLSGRSRRPRQHHPPCPVPDHPVPSLRTQTSSLFSTPPKPKGKSHPSPSLSLGTVYASRHAGFQGQASETFPGHSAPYSYRVRLAGRGPDRTPQKASGVV